MPQTRKNNPDSGTMRNDTSLPPLLTNRQRLCDPGSGKIPHHPQASHKWNKKTQSPASGRFEVLLQKNRSAGPGHPRSHLLHKKSELPRSVDQYLPLRSYDPACFCYMDWFSANTFHHHQFHASGKEYCTLSPRCSHKADIHKLSFSRPAHQ